MAKSCGCDAVTAVIDGVDTKIDNLVGVKPLEMIERVIDTLAPANVIEHVTGLPKPSEVVADVQDKIESTVKGGIGSLPEMPSLPQLPGL